MFKMITKIECYDCGINLDIRKCTDHNNIVFYLCCDCLIDRTEDFFEEEESEGE